LRVQCSVPEGHNVPVNADETAEPAEIKTAFPATTSVSAGELMPIPTFPDGDW
jgi:hypothetical protein